MAKIELTSRLPENQGLFAIVDDDVHEALAARKWYAHRARGSRTIYAKTYGEFGWRYMHHFILVPVAGKEVDHKDGNGLDNRRENLRHVTHKRNVIESNKRLRAERSRVPPELEESFQAWVREHSTGTDSAN
jgi:hypothetical protein